MYYKKYDHPLLKVDPEECISWVPVTLTAAMIVSLTVASYLLNDKQYVSSFICSSYALTSYGWYLLNSRDRDYVEFFRGLDLHTGLFLAGILVLVGSLGHSNLVEYAAKYFIAIFGSAPYHSFAGIIMISLVISAFILNIPYIAAMLPVTELIAWQTASNQTPLLFGLLLGGTVGGNITPFGASSNVVVIGLLKKKGYETRFFDFLRIGLAHAILTTIVGGAYIWFIMN